MLAVQDLGMELHAGEAATEVLERRHRRAVGLGRDEEPGRRLGHRVAVRHPHADVAGDVGEQGARGDDAQRRAAELAQPGAGDGAPERLGHGLEAVADAEDGDSGLEQLGVE